MANLFALFRVSALLVCKDRGEHLDGANRSLLESQMREHYSLEVENTMQSSSICAFITDNF